MFFCFSSTQWDQANVATHNIYRPALDQGLLPTNY